MFLVGFGARNYWRKRMVFKFFCAILILCFPVFTEIGNAWSHPTIIENVRGYTLAAGGLLRFDALVFDSEGKVVGVGKAAELIADSSPATRIDGKGHVLLPGLTDAHGHIKWLGESLRSIDLSRAKTLSSAQEAISEFAMARPGETWLTGSGWNQVVWRISKRSPSVAHWLGMAMTVSPCAA